MYIWHHNAASCMHGPNDPRYDQKRITFFAVSVPSYSGRTLPYINPWYNPWAQVGMQTKSMILETFLVEPISNVMLCPSCRMPSTCLNKMCFQVWLGFSLPSKMCAPNHVNLPNLSFLCDPQQLQLMPWKPNGAAHAKFPIMKR